MMRCLIFCLLCVLASASLHGQEVKDDEIEKIKSLMVQKVQQEVRRIYQNEFRLIANDYVEYFELNAETSKKLNDLADKFAKKRQEGHTDQSIEATLVRKIGAFDGIESFTVNGKRSALDDSQQDPIAKITVSGVSGRIFLSANRGGSTLASVVRIELEKQEEWREALSELTDEQLSDFDAEMENRKVRQLLELMESVIANELLATEQQIPALREWLKSQVREPTDRSLIRQAKHEIAGLDLPLPECFSEAQREFFRHLRFKYEDQ